MTVSPLYSNDLHSHQIPVQLRTFGMGLNWTNPQQQFDATRSIWTQISDECFQYQKLGSYKGRRASNDNNSQYQGSPLDVRFNTDMTAIFTLDLLTYVLIKLRNSILKLDHGC